MMRVSLSILAVIAVSGCGQLRWQLAEGPCDDCLPPPVAGKHKYHRKLDDWLTTLTAQGCARRDLKAFQDDCGPFSRDFKDGYTQAYIDLAAGRPACVPAVPPPKYWHAWHRSCAGRGAVDDWYDGYRNGLDVGVNGGVNRFNRIVPNADGCCVSAAYVDPYAASSPPQVVQPLSGQTVMDAPRPDASLANTARDGTAAWPGPAHDLAR